VQLLDTGRGLRSQRIRLTPSRDGRFLVVHRSDLHPAALEPTGPLLRHGRVAYDLVRREPVSARLSRGTAFLVGADSTRVLSRSCASAAAWDPTGTSVLLVEEGPGPPTPAVWDLDGTVTRWPRAQIAGSLLGFRGGDRDHGRGRGLGIGWTVDGSPLLLHATRPGPGRLIRAATDGWDDGIVGALWEAAACNLTALGRRAAHPIRANVAVTTMEGSACGTTVLLGMLTGRTELQRFLRADLVPYWVLHLAAGEAARWTDVGVLPRGSVRLVDEPPNAPAVIYLEAAAVGTLVWDAVTGDRLAELDHGVSAHAGIPGRSGCWAAPGSSTLIFDGGRLELPGVVRGIRAVPGSELTEFDVDLAGAAKPGPVTVRLDRRAAAPAATTRTFWSPHNQQTIDVTADRGTLTVRADRRTRRVTLWGRPKSSPEHRRLRWIEALRDGPLLSITAPPVVTDETPLVWLEPVMAAQIHLPSEPRQLLDEPLVPGSPEWCHSDRRLVVRAMLPVDWSSTATFASVQARILAGLAVVGDWLRRETPSAYGSYVLGGHSFGAAAATVAACAGHSQPDCLLLRSGAYDRFLTPAGFQWERRSVLEAPDIYRGFTVIDRADALRCPVLLIHGSADHNLGTPPAQSRALFDALQAARGTARLVELVGEGHEIITRTAAATVADEERRWLRTHSPPRPAAARATETHFPRGAACRR
jgi:hypothetical protein